MGKRHLVTIFPHGGAFEGMKTLLKWEKLHAIPHPDGSGTMVKPMGKEGLTGEIDDADMAEAQKLGTVKIIETKGSDDPNAPGRTVTELEAATDPDLDLVQAFNVLGTHYSPDASKVPADMLERATSMVVGEIARFAFSKFVLGLIDDGYVVEARAAELRERAINHGAGRGFVTNAALGGAAPASTPKPEPQNEDAIADLFD